MKGDRYLKAILTIVAVELAWIGFQLSAAPVTAQQAQVQAPAPVVITGVDINGSRGFLPVAVLGQMRSENRAFVPVETTVRNERVAVSVAQPVDVRAIGTVKVEAERPLRVENVGYTPAQRPGE